MALFGNDKTRTGERLTGIARYMELFGRDYRRFLVANLYTVLAFVPFGVGVLISWSSSSIPLMLLVCVITGTLVGPAISCMYDAAFRSLRDVQGKATANYHRAWKQNWKASIVPGMIYCVLLGSIFFMAMIFLFAEKFPGYALLIVFVISVLITVMFFTAYFMQISLLEQRTMQRCTGCLLLLGKYFWKFLLVGILQIVYWVLMILFIPYTLILFPIIGFWLIQFTVAFILYRPLNETFQIEKRIAEKYPEQATYYEADSEWMKRRRGQKPEKRK